MCLVVMELRVELRPKQQRDEPDQRQRDREQAGYHDRSRPRTEPCEAQPRVRRQDPWAGGEFACSNVAME